MTTNRARIGILAVVFGLAAGPAAGAAEGRG